MKFEKKYMKYLGNKGYIVTMDFYDGDIFNYQDLNEFCDYVQKMLENNDHNGEKECDLFYIQVNGSLLKYHFKYEKGKVIFTASTSNISDDGTSVTAPFITRYELKTFKYTERGWLFIEQHADEDNEMNGHQAIKVTPFNSEYKELCEKYIERIGYQCNNLFITSWSENDYSNINFNDLFEFLYYEKTGEELEHNAFYDGIPEEEFYSLNKEYFNISNEKLKELAKYNNENNTFLWSRIGCLSYSPDISGEPFAEVIDKVDNSDGTFTLVISTVWEWYNTDCAFVEELTIRKTENGFQYVSNKIRQSDNNRVPIYKNRV